MTDLKLVPPATVSDDIKASVVQILIDVKALAAAGDVDTMIIILGHPDGSWSTKLSGTEKLSAAIGRLEIAKQEWIALHLELEND